MSGFLGSPGNLGGLAPSAVAATGASGGANFAMTAPQLPTGWTITNGIAMMVLNNDPSTGTNWYSYAEADSSSPYDPTFTGLAAGSYEWAAWFEYTRPDGRTAYGPSTGGSVTVS
jgi:hypothetical protein